MSEIVTVEIQSLVNEGYGFGRIPDGRAVFMPFVMPGEIVEGRITQEKKNHVFAELLEVRQAHPSRLTPRCRHFGICGGCQFQHIPYELQLDYKQAIFSETLQRLSGIHEITNTKILSSHEKWNYRNTMQFHLSGAGHPAYAEWKHNELFEIQECYLPMAVIDEVRKQLDFDQGAFERIELRQNDFDDWMLVLHGNSQEVPEITVEGTTSVVHLDGRDKIVMAGDGHLTMRVMDVDFRVSAGSFFQTNFFGAELLVRNLMELVKSLDCQILIDVFSGVGLFSAFLADQMSQIVAVESSPYACEDFAFNLDRFDNISLYQGRAEQILPILDIVPDCVLLDPPRGGLLKEALQGLLKISPKALIYVSCNPATLARDMKYILQSGYQLKSSLLIDMFPQTNHIESINFLVKA